MTREVSLHLWSSGPNRNTTSLKQKNNFFHLKFQVLLSQERSKTSKLTYTKVVTYKAGRRDEQLKVLRMQEPNFVDRLLTVTGMQHTPEVETGASSTTIKTNKY